MKSGKRGTLRTLLIALLCAALLSLPALAYGEDSGRNHPLLELQVEEADEDASQALLNLLSSLMEAFTPEGNLSLIDDFRYSGLDEDGNSIGKQFLTVQSKNGNYFFIIIDRAATDENVYFLNLVDEADLLALTDDAPAKEAPAVCTCKDKCYAGHVETACPVCAVNMSLCLGKAAAPTPTATPDEPETPTKSAAVPPIAAVVLLLAVGGGAAYFFLKIRGKAKPRTKGGTDLSEYDFGEDDGEEYAFESYEPETEDGGTKNPEDSA